jgi:hypothetical protein
MCAFFQPEEADGAKPVSWMYQQAKQSALISPHLRLLSRGRRQAVPAEGVARPQLARYNAELCAFGMEERQEDDGGHQPLKSPVDLLQPGRRLGFHFRNAVVMPAALLGYHSQLQQLADALPAGTIVVALGPQHGRVA